MNLGVSYWCMKLGKYIQTMAWVQVKRGGEGKNKHKNFCWFLFQKKKTKKFMFPEMKSLLAGPK